jgi:hypothetical protein
MLEPNFIFDMPKRERKRSNPQAIAELIEAIDHCLISVGRDTSNVEHLGITLEPEHGKLNLYSTDGGTIARASIGNRLPLERRTILPTPFCEQMLRLYRDDKAQVHFELGEQQQTDERRYAMFSAGEVSLFGRVLETRSPLNLQGTVEHFLPDGYQQQLVPIPDRLRKALNLHAFICDETRLLMTLTVRAGTLHLKSQDDGEEINEVMPLPGHRDVAVRIEPKLLRQAMDFDQMLVTPRCVVMSASGGVYLVSTRPAAEEEEVQVPVGE